MFVEDAAQRERHSRLRSQPARRQRGSSRRRRRRCDAAIRDGAAARPVRRARGRCGDDRASNRQAVRRVSCDGITNHGITQGEDSQRSRFSEGRAFSSTTSRRCFAIARVSERRSRRWPSPSRARNIDVVVGVESRGFILGGAVADRLGAGFAPVRKKGQAAVEDRPGNLRSRIRDRLPRNPFRRGRAGAARADHRRRACDRRNGGGDDRARAKAGRQTCSRSRFWWSSSSSTGGRSMPNENDVQRPEILRHDRLS